MLAFCGVYGFALGLSLTVLNESLIKAVTIVLKRVDDLF